MLHLSSWTWRIIRTMQDSPVKSSHQFPDIIGYPFPGVSYLDLGVFNAADDQPLNPDNSGVRYLEDRLSGRDV